MISDDSGSESSEGARSGRARRLRRALSRTPGALPRRTVVSERARGRSAASAPLRPSAGPAPPPPAARRVAPRGCRASRLPASPPPGRGARRAARGRPGLPAPSSSRAAGLRGAAEHMGDGRGRGAQAGPGLPRPRRGGAGRGGGSGPGGRGSGVAAGGGVPLCGGNGSRAGGRAEGCGPGRWWRRSGPGSRGGARVEPCRRATYPLCEPPPPPRVPEEPGEGASCTGSLPPHSASVFVLLPEMENQTATAPAFLEPSTDTGWTPTARGQAWGRRREHGVRGRRGPLAGGDASIQQVAVSAPGWGADRLSPPGPPSPRATPRRKRRLSRSPVEGNHLSSCANAPSRQIQPRSSLPLPPLGPPPLTRCWHRDGERMAAGRMDTPRSVALVPAGGFSVPLRRDLR